jgi:hypothetical protein
MYGAGGFAIYFIGSKLFRKKTDVYDDKYAILSGMEDSAKTQFFPYRDENYLKPEAKKSQNKYVGALSDPTNLPDAPKSKGK